MTAARLTYLAALTATAVTATPAKNHTRISGIVVTSLVSLVLRRILTPPADNLKLNHAFDYGPGHFAQGKHGEDIGCGYWGTRDGAGGAYAVPTARATCGAATPSRTHVETIASMTQRQQPNDYPPVDDSEEIERDEDEW